MEKTSKREREKLCTEQKIIEAANLLFCQNGFENTSVDAIAKEADYTKRTIYKYFTCKEDLFFAVILKAYNDIEKYVNQNFSQTTTAFEKISKFYHSFRQLSSSGSNLLKLMGMIQLAKNAKSNALMPYKENFNSYNEVFFIELIDLFKEGKEDGSICSSFDSTKLAYSSFFTIVGFYLMLSTSGNSYTQNFKLDKDEFVDFTINFLMDSFKAN